jgi:hypothetical protein
MVLLAFLENAILECSVYQDCIVITMSMVEILLIENVLA